MVTNKKLNKNSFSIKNFLANAKMRIKLMSIVISICLFSLVSMSIVSYLALNNIVKYTKHVNTTLGKNFSEGASKASLDQAHDFLQIIAREQSQICNNTLNSIKFEVEQLSNAAQDLFNNPQYYSLSRPVVAPSDTTDDSYNNTYYLAPGVTMTPDIQRELDLLSHLSILAPSLLNDVNISEMYVAMDSGLLYFYSALRYSDSSYDPRLRSWYIDAVNSMGDVIFTDVYEDKFNKGAVLTVAQAFFDDSGKFLGVAAVDIEISNLQNQILGTKITDTGYTIIVDNCGMYILHPDMYKDGFDLNIDKTEGKYIVGYEEGLMRMMKGEAGVVEGSLNGRDIFMIFNPIPVADWSIGVVVYKDDLLVRLKELSYQLDTFIIDSEERISNMVNRAKTAFIVIFIAVAIMVAFATMWLTYLISKPIQRLADEVINIGDNNFEYRIPVEALDEIGLIAEAYNKMMDNMSRYAEKIVSLNKQNSKLEITANIDSLTGILNRGRFMDLLKDVANKELDENKSSFIIMFDLDHFKRINDTYGHSAGDKVLKSVAQKVKSKIESQDLFARYGGEEFIILIENVTTSDIVKLAERIRHNICKKPVEFNGIKIPVSASIGVAKISEKDFEAAISNADESLYKAKNSGRNRVVLYEKEF